LIEDDKDKVFTSPIVQASGSQMQDQNMASSSQSNDQASTSNQVLVLQPINVARDHPLVQVIGGIQNGVQTRSRLASFCEHYSFV
jgi:hypothetical protein